MMIHPPRRDTDVPGTLVLRCTRYLIALLAALTMLLPAGTVQAQGAGGADTLSGRVTSAETGMPINGAVVFVTRGPDRLVQQDTANADGRWRVVFSPGTGDYLVFIAAPGAQSFRKRVTRVASERAFVVDAVLRATGGAQLAAVRVQAQAPRPERPNRTGALPTTGSNERIAEGVYGAVSPLAAGNPTAIAATIPGLVVGPNGITALGAGGDQSLVTLNGLASGASIPREARTRTRGSLSNYDPSIGGFSGALVSQELEAGREDTERRGSITLDAPALRASDPLARAYGLRPTTFQASLGQTGQIIDDRLFYTAAAQLSRRHAQPATLLTAPGQVLALSGLDIGDVTLVQQGLQSTGISLTGSGQSAVVDQVNLVGQLDRTPRGMHAMRFTGLIDAQRSTGVGITPVSLPGVGSREQVVTAAAQFGSVAILGTRRPYQNDFRSSVSVQANRYDATSRLPAGAVRLPDITGDPLDPTVAVPTISFGGYGGLTGTRTSATWELADDLSFLRGGRTHLFKLHAWSRIDALRDETVSDARGTFSFNTLDDLVAGTPSVYTRTLAQPARDGATWNAATAFAHRWGPSRVFQLLWGARVDASRFLGAPAPNAHLESTLGLRTDRVPSSVSVSPRLGITWYLVKDAAGGTMTRASDLASRSSLPVGMIRAGVGAFRGIYRPDVLANADGATGAPGAFRRITCVGSAAPTPDWDVYGTGAAPTTCAAGAPGLADGAPSVSLLGDAYRAPRNWRASAGWTSRAAKVDYRLDATYALNFDQASVIDRNLRDAPIFTLPDEGGRAVFVPRSSIDAGTGSVSAAASRLSESFGPVLERRGDLRGRARSVTLSLTPDLSDLSGGDTYLNLNYTWASARAAGRGFDSGSGADPRRIEWARSPFDVRHQLIAQLARTFPAGIGLSLFLSMQSGTPFTPMVAGDVNGDGRANDRAFIPRAGSPALDALVAGAPDAVARCLRAQGGQIAARNSCDGPWTQSMQLRLDLPGRLLRLPNRARVALQFANPLGAIDRAVNGADGLRGWGTASLPNPVLLVPRSFEATASRFGYDLNPRFGETRPSRVSRPLEPYGVTLDVRLNLSVPGEVQELQRQMKPGRRGDTRPRLNADTLMARYQRSMPSLFTGLRALSDTLLLTATQQDSLAGEEVRYRAALDTVYRPLVVYLAALPDSYDGKEALQRVQAVDSLAWEVTYATGAKAKAVLSPLQLTILPEFLRRLIEEPVESMRRDHVRYELDVSPQGSSFSMSRR
ncbi:MAG: carboxypeptidase regulatory-like domain-containing protein [Gemmatimonadaceae bacterium]|nr:carboxypeptidase regulatory-like domain-containing protein [Gemmatimonadaceae bacterium]